MTLTPFRSESTRSQRRASRRAAQPDVTGYVDSPEPADDTGGFEDDLVISEADLELWELEDRFAEPAADPTPGGLPQPPPAPVEAPQRQAPHRRRRRQAQGGATTARRPRPAPSERPAPPSSRPAPSAGRRRRRPAPVMRLGVLWALALGLAIGFAPPLAAVLLMPVTAIAAHTAWRRMDPPVTAPGWLPAVAAGLCPLVAIAGPIPAAIAVTLAAVAVAVLTGGGVSTDQQVRLGVCVAAPAAASASLIAATALSPTIGLSLLTAVCLFDAANYIMGVGDTGGALGAFAGISILAVLALLLAGLFVVPFGGLSPWILCGVVAVGAILSTGAAHSFVGRVRLPAWRRLDSLFIAGPLWVLISALFVVH